jgi:hypothetical protein
LTAVAVASLIEDCFRSPFRLDPRLLLNLTPELVIAKGQHPAIGVVGQLIQRTTGRVSSVGAESTLRRPSASATFRCGRRI